VFSIGIVNSPIAKDAKDLQQYDLERKEAKIKA
jgi:hypothetical protein